jgi:hypothetical protein
MAEKVVSNQEAIDAAKAKADAAATAKTAASAAGATALAAKKAQLDALTKRVNVKKGTATGKAPTAETYAGLQTSSRTAINQFNTASTAYATAQANVVAIPETEYREILGTSGRAILKNKMIELGLPSTIIDSSVTFIDTLVTDGMSIDAATDAYYNNKDFTTKKGTTVTSPFYTEFTYLRESAPKDGNLPTPLELMKFKLGVKNLVTTYGRSALFSSDDALKNYISNGVRLTDLDVRFADASVASTAANPDTVKTLKKLGYITDTQDVADFLLDSKIGQQQFEINRNTAAFAQQALKRAGSGISFDAARMKQLAASAGITQGTAAGAENAGAVGYETIGLQLNPLTKIESIYGKPTDATGKNLTDVQVRSQLQTELEAEQFQGTASERRKRRIEEEQLAYQRKSGTVTGGSGASISLGRGGITGAL